MPSTSRPPSPAKVACEARATMDLPTAPGTCPTSTQAGGRVRACWRSRFSSSSLTSFGWMDYPEIDITCARVTLDTRPACPKKVARRTHRTGGVRFGLPPASGRLLRRGAPLSAPMRPSRCLVPPRRYFAEPTIGAAWRGPPAPSPHQCRNSARCALGVYSSASLIVTLPICRLAFFIDHRGMLVNATTQHLRVRPRLDRRLALLSVQPVQQVQPQGVRPCSTAR